ERTLDASGQVVTPGFIDMHSHADQTLMVYPGAENFRTQGVTTVVGGNCGFTLAPLNHHYTAGFWEWNWWNEVNPRKYYQEPVADLETARRAMMEHEGVDMNWRTFGEFLETLDRTVPALNLVPLVGHSTIRTAVMGEDYRRHCTREELSEMVNWVREAMDAGAFGLSNGLDYAPGAYASDEENVAVVRAAAERGGMFATHWRRTGLREGMGSPVLIRGLKEAIDIAREADADLLQVSHLLPGYSVFPETPDEMRRASAHHTLEVLDRAVASGLNVYWDVIPNTGGGVLSLKYTAALLSPWLGEAGSLEQLSRNLRAPDLRAEITEYIEAGRWYSLNPLTNPEWASGLIISHHCSEDICDRSLAQIARDRNVGTLEALFDLLVEDPFTRTRSSEGSEATHRIFFEHGRTMVALDTFAMDTSYDVTVPPYFLPHPNTFGGMPRYFQRLGIPTLGLEEAVHRVTGLPAEVLGLSDRGQIEPGKRADIAVFSPDEFENTATAEEPRQYARGISHLLINGTVSIEDGNMLQERSGEVLRR
ncbi:MAG: amidohydrolase family protein, partial [Bacillota bacterium]